MAIAENEVNLHHLDSARNYIENAKKSEAQLQVEGTRSKPSGQYRPHLLSAQLSRRQTGVVCRLQSLLRSVTTAMLYKDNTSMRRLEMRNRLLTANNELHRSVQSMAWWILSLVL